MSAIEALVTPTMSDLSASVTVCSVPSFPFTSSELAVTFSMVPLRRCGCCAEADVTAAIRATPVKIAILLICFLQVTCFKGHVAENCFAETCFAETCLRSRAWNMPANDLRAVRLQRRAAEAKPPADLYIGGV